MRLTVAEQLDDVEKMIVTLRWARNDPALPEHRMLRTLKCLASDLRERRTVSATAAVLQRRVDEVERSRTGEGGFGFTDAKPLIGLATETLGRWPGIKRALEQYAKEEA